jgi:periplasmic copper chaperone A
MKFAVAFAPLAGLLLLAASTAARADIEIVDPYVRGLPPGVPNTAAYMTLRNSGTQAVDLTGARSSISASVMLHSTVNHDGMMHMMHVDKVVIPAQGEVALASGGLHLMLMQLKEHPPAGSEVELVLQFSDGSELSVLAPVRSVLDE